MRCNKCRKELRPRKTKKADHPGTIEHYGQGYCKTCWNIVEPDRERAFRPEGCADCNRPLRPKDALLKDHPGTVPHRAFGKCQTCYRIDKAKASPAVEVDEPVQITDPGVLRLMAQREERRRRQERAQLVRQEQEAVQRRFIANRRKQAA